MLITDENFPKPRFWLDNSIQNFDEENIGKRICFLVWSCDSRMISQQIDFAMEQSADLIISEIYPHEVPEDITIGQYDFVKSRIIFLKPEKGVQLRLEEKDSNNCVDLVYQEKSTSQDFQKTIKIISENELFNVIFIEEDESVESYEFNLKSNSLVIYINDLALKRAVIYECQKSNIQIFLGKNTIFKFLDYLSNQSGESPIVTNNSGSIRSNITSIINIAKKDKLGDFIELDEQPRTEIYQREFFFEIPLRYTDRTKDSCKKKHLTRFIKNFYCHRILDCKSRNKENDFNSRLFLRDWFTDLTEAIQNPYSESEFLKFFKVAGMEYSLQVIGEIVSKQNDSLLNYDILCFSLAKRYFLSKENEENSLYFQLLKLINEKGIIAKSSVFQKHLMEFLNEIQKQDGKITDSLEKLLEDKKNQAIKDKIFRIYSLNLSLNTFLEVILKDKFKEHLNPKGFTEILKDKFAVKSIVEIYSLPDQSDGISSNLSLVFKSLGVKNLTNDIWQNAFVIKFAEYVDLFDFEGLNASAAYSSLVGIFIKSKKPLSSLSNLKTVEDNLEKNEGFSELLELVQSFQKGQFSNENKNSYLLHNFLCNDGSIESKFITELESNISRTDLDILKNC